MRFFDVVIVGADALRIQVSGEHFYFVCIKIKFPEIVFLRR